jgi:hypothetical protein
MVERHGTVSSGEGRRRQVSHGRSVLADNIMLSLKNFVALIKLANESDDTEKLVKAMTRTPDKGGMTLVGMLTAQEIINMLTKLGIIHNQHHMNNVLIAKGTKTDKRLSSMGITTVEEKSQLVAYLSRKMRLSESKVEYALCEAMRFKFSQRRNFHDTIARHQYIYTMDDGKLRAYDLEGQEVEVTVPSWKQNSKAFRGVQWWQNKYEKTGETVVLTTNDSKH